jgi:Tfp pilus assembly protein PilV
MAGFTLAEVLVSIALAATTIGGVIACYLMAAQRSEWSSASGAAHRQVMMRMEQLKAARWDLAFTNGELDTLVGGPVAEPAQVLDVPQTGFDFLWATNWTTVSNVVGSAAPLRLLRVDCVWSLPTRGPFTNTLITYRAPDQ